MKKYQILILILSIFFTSCKSNKDCDCTSNYESVSLKFNSKIANFNEYSSSKLKSKYFRNVTNSNNIPTIVKQKDSPDFNFKSLDNIKATFYIINSDNHQVNDNSDIIMDIVDGIVYYNQKNDYYLVSAFIRNNQIFNKTEISDIKTKYYSPNQIYDISTKVFNIEHPIIIAIVSDDIINNINNDDDVLKFRFVEEAFEHCYSPCYLTTAGICEERAPGDAECKQNDDGPVICIAEKSTEKLNENNISFSGYADIANKLHLFRDEYLKKHKGGIELLYKYYNQSKRNYQLLDIDLAQRTLNILNFVKNDIDNLRQYPNANSILIDSNEKNQIINYLNFVQTKVTNQETQNIISKTINLVNTLYGKTNQEITNYLDSDNFNF